MVGSFPVDDVSDIAQPTLIIGNDQDPLHPWEMAVQWQNEIEGSELLQVPSRYVNGESHKVQVREALVNFIETINA